MECNVLIKMDSLACREAAIVALNVASHVHDVDKRVGRRVTNQASGFAVSV